MTSRRTFSAVVAAAIGLATLLIPLAPARALNPDCSAVASKLTALGLTAQSKVSTDGLPYTFWSGKIASWDGIPLMTDLTVPASPGCGLPLISFNHGYGADRKTYEADAGVGRGAGSYHDNNVWFVGRGYAVLNYDARGFGQSCGKAASSDGTAAGLPAACTAAGRHYWINLSDARYALRDLQWLIGQLVDSGVADPTKLGVVGQSMGAGLSSEAAVLNDRVVCGGQGFTSATGQKDPCSGKANLVTVPWVSASGVPLHISAAVPQWGWAYLASGLAPNGRSTDGLAGAPAPGPDRTPIGIPLQSWAKSLYSTGLSKGFFAPATAGDSYSNFGVWLQDLGYQAINSATTATGTALGNALTNGLAQMDAGKSPGSTSFRFDAKVPILAVQGLSDSIFSSQQTEVLRRLALAYAPDYPMGVIYSDIGHQPATNPTDEWQVIGDRVTGFLDYELTGVGPEPASTTQLATFRCLPSLSGSPLETVTAPTLAASQTGGIDVTSTLRQTTTNTGGGLEATTTDPFNAASNRSCPRMAKQHDKGVDSWAFTTPSAPAVVVGSPVVTVAAHTTGVDAELNVRLWEMDADGTQTLISRGTYRMTGAPTTTDKTIPIELSGTAWRLPPGTGLKVEVTGYDAPTYAPDAITATTSIDSVTLHLPTTDASAYGNAFLVSGVDGTFSGAMAAFGDAHTQPGAYTATVDWGDGTSSAATLMSDGTQVTVAGNHSYDNIGAYTTAVTVSAVADNVSVRYQGQITVVSVPPPSPSPSPSETPSDPPSPAPSPSDSPSDTPSPTPSSDPSDSPGPTDSPTPTPSP
ncbi:MAG: CocE/NonD family hydrolase C-terminal non-catalytic domain-containing protein [Actinomycetes bacterium]